MFDLTIRLSVLSSLAFLVNGAAWPGPAPTPVGYGIPMEGISPKPTPRARIKGRYAGHELFERADNPLSICGYVSGVRSSSVTCPGGRSCFYNAPISAAGCCFYSSDTPADCGQYTGCVPSSSLSACTGTCASDGLMIKCSNSAAPYCFTFAFPGFNNIGCAAIPGSQNVLFTYSGQATDITSAERSQVQTSVITATVTAQASGATAGLIGINPTDTSSSSSDSSSSKSNSSKKSGSNIGAIAGGAVGGLAILALFILALVWLLRRNKKNKATAAAVTAVGAGGMQQQKPFDGQHQQQQHYDAGVYDPQQPMSPAPQYNPAPGGFYDQAGAIPQKHEYSQQPGIQQPVGYSEISAVPPTQYQQPQYQQPPPPPAQPIYEAPTTQH